MARCRARVLAHMSVGGDGRAHGGHRQNTGEALGVGCHEGVDVLGDYGTYKGKGCRVGAACPVAQPWRRAPSRSLVEGEVRPLNQPWGHTRWLYTVSGTEMARGDRGAPVEWWVL